MASTAGGQAQEGQPFSFPGVQVLGRDSSNIRSGWWLEWHLKILTNLRFYVWGQRLSSNGTHPRIWRFSNLYSLRKTQGLTFYFLKPLKACLSLWQGERREWMLMGEIIDVKMNLRKLQSRLRGSARLGEGDPYVELAWQNHGVKAILRSLSSPPSCF